MTKHRVASVVATGILAVASFLPAEAAEVIDEPVAAIPELDGLRNRNQLISLRFGGGAQASTVFDAIAVAGNMHIAVDGLENCCLVKLDLSNSRLRDALELIASKIDLQYEVQNPDSLSVRLLEPVLPGPDDGVTMPVVENPAVPVYPQAARDARAEGSVLMMVEVRADGTVGEVNILSHAEGWPAFDEAAVAAVRQRTYRPAMRDGCPLSVYLTVSVAFRLR